MPRSLRPTWLLSLLTLAGCNNSAYQGPASDHFDGERFHNIQPTAEKSLRDLLKWQLNRERTDAWIEKPAAAQAWIPACAGMTVGWVRYG